MSWSRRRPSTKGYALNGLSWIPAFAGMTLSPTAVHRAVHHYPPPCPANAALCYDEATLGQQSWTDTLRIATWNVNSVRQRLEHLLDWMKETQPDVVCLQEIKCVDEAFPRAEIESLGYNVATHGQKTFNGVAILSKYPMECETRLPGDLADEQSRYIEAVVSHDGGITRVASIYLPNGNGGPEKYAYKLGWMERLRHHAQELLKLEESLVLAGDFNVIPEARDVKTPGAWLNDALFLPQTRAAFRELLALGLTDALRAVTDAADVYTFWDYTAGAWRRNEGIRIDHLLLSPQAADRLKNVAVDRNLRALEKPSDHVPIRIDLV